MPVRRSPRRGAAAPARAGHTGRPRLSLRRPRVRPAAARPRRWPRHRRPPHVLRQVASPQVLARAPARAAGSPEAGPPVGGCGFAAGLPGAPGSLGSQRCRHSLRLEPCWPQLQLAFLKPALSLLDRPFLRVPRFSTFFTRFLNPVRATHAMVHTHLPRGWQVLLSIRPIFNYCDPLKLATKHVTVPTAQLRG